MKHVINFFKDSLAKARESRTFSSKISVSYSSVNQMSEDSPHMLKSPATVHMTMLIPTDPTPARTPLGVPNIPGPDTANQVFKVKNVWLMRAFQLLLSIIITHT